MPRHPPLGAAGFHGLDHGLLQVRLIATFVAVVDTGMLIVDFVFNAVP